MSNIFGIHFAVHDEAGRLHQWSPGEEVPEWVDPLIGDHCLLLPPDESDEQEECDTEEDSAPSEPDAEGEEDTQEAPGVPAIGAALDFTKPAPAKRGRPRKAE